jgi:hypothetical protein
VEVRAEGPGGGGVGGEERECLEVGRFGLAGCGIEGILGVAERTEEAGVGVADLRV